MFTPPVTRRTSGAFCINENRTFFYVQSPLKGDFFPPLFVVSDHTREIATEFYLVMKKLPWKDIYEKSDLDDYKSCMDIPFIEKPETFFSYSMGDAMVLYKIYNKIVINTNKVMIDTLGLPGFLAFRRDDFPNTNGRLVSHVFTKMLLFWSIGCVKDKEEYYKKLSRLNLAFGKLSILDPAPKSYRQDVVIWNDLYKHRDLESMENFISEKNLGNHKVVKASCYPILPYSHASIKWFLLQDNISFTKNNAIVTGGRCTNEIPWKYKHEYCADIDMAGCYGSSLRSFTYPVGIPSLYSGTPNEEGLTLRDFLEKYKEELVPNLSKITVSGKLSFEQDLIFEFSSLQK